MLQPAEFSMSDLLNLSNALSALAASVAPRIIAVEGADGRQASGFIWRSGLAVTAHDALEGEEDAEVLLADGSVLKASIAGRDPSTDVALLKFETGEFGDWATADTVLPGSLALVAGRSEQSPIASLASITEVGPAWRSMRGGDIAARITLGLRLSGHAEGGAVVAPDGALVGMAVTGAGGRAIAIPAPTIARAVATLADKGYVPRGWLGVSLHPLGKGGGAIIVGLEPESPAAQAGLLVGDIITTWNGEAVGSVRAISDRLGTGAVGTNVKLGVHRGGNAGEYDIAIAERPRR
jgi:S1-C subfamily serine protease